MSQQRQFKWIPQPQVSPSQSEQPPTLRSLYEESLPSQPPQPQLLRLPSRPPRSQFQQLPSQPFPYRQQIDGPLQGQRVPVHFASHPGRSGWSRVRLLALLSLVAAVIFFAFLASSILVLQGQKAPAAAPKSISQTTSSKHQVVLQPTTQTTHLPSMEGPPMLGGDISAFIAKYGQPAPLSNPTAGTYFFQPYDNAHADFLTVTTARDDPQPYKTRALIILANAPPDKVWSLTQAEAICLSFTPSDAVLKQSTIFPDTLNPLGIQKVYYSASLSKQFPASDFVDSNLKPIMPGTFSVVLNYAGSATRISSCSTQVPLQ